MRKKLLSTSQVAAWTGISAATLISWRSKGNSNLKFYKLGRRVLYSELEVIVWLKTKETTTARAEL